MTGDSKYVEPYSCQKLPLGRISHTYLSDSCYSLCYGNKYEQRARPGHRAVSICIDYVLICGKFHIDCPLTLNWSAVGLGRQDGAK